MVEAIRGRPPEKNSWWNADFSTKCLIERFDSPADKEIINQAAGLSRKTLESRWQLGFKPILQYREDGRIGVYVPSMAETGRNNRYLHSLEAAMIGLELTEQLELPQEEKKLLAVALLFHDFMHPVFSHLGERFLEEAYSQFKQKPRFSQELSDNNLLGSHEVRLLREATNNNSKLASFLSQHFNSRQREQVKRIWREKGILGTIASLADTLAYLNFDNLFFGRFPPLFEGDLKRRLQIKKVSETKRILNFFDIDDPSKIPFEEIVEEREKLFKLQYASLISALTEQMQIKMSWDYFETVGGEDLGRARAKQIKVFFGQSDQEVLKLMRRRTLIRQKLEGLAFFGLLPKISTPSNYPNDPNEGRVGDIVVTDPYYPKGFFVSEKRRVLPRKFRLSFLPTDFWETLRPVLETLCANCQDSPPSSFTPLTPEKIKGFFTACFPEGKLKGGGLNEEEGEILDFIFGKLLSQDFSYQWTFTNPKIF